MPASFLKNMNMATIVIHIKRDGNKYKRLQKS